METEVNSKEYREQVYNIYKKGGTLFLIERGDTHEFYTPSFELHIHTFGKGWNERHCSWSKTVGIFQALSGYLTKEDAAQNLFMLDDLDTKVPITITEHQFINP